MFSILKVLCACMSQKKTQPPSRYNVLMLRCRSCKMVAKVVCLVAIGSGWQLPIVKFQRLLVSMNEINQPTSRCNVLMLR